ncbi:MAG TPA: hypothetical protein VIL49_14005 [Capillimicrobium sp.]
MSLLYDDRVRLGLQRQLELRQRRIADGEQPIGWKAGFGAPAAMEALGTAGPMVGFLTDRSRVADGGEVSVDGWAAPTVEVEIAARMAADLPGGATREQAAGAIGALAPAIELVDLDGPRGPEDLEEVLAGGIFHRRVVLGAFDGARAGGSVDGLRVTVEAGGEIVAEAVDPRAMVGEVVDVVRAIADLLDAAGERLRADEVLITGATVPVFAGRPGMRVDARVDGLGAVAVRLA